MVNNIYILPQEDLVGGESREFQFRLYTQNGVPFSIHEGSAYFALINYSNKSGAPILSKSCSTTVGPEGVENTVAVELHSQETLELFGKYIYQVTIIDRYGEAEIPGQGILHITRNINRGIH